MQTYTHFLMTAVLNTSLKARKVAVDSKMLLLGSVLPDFPLILLSGVTWLYYGWINPVMGDARMQMQGGLFRLMDIFYFTDPVWIASISLFQSPLMLLAFSALGWWAYKRGYQWGLPLLWLMVGCSLHSFVDILTHHDDGPVLFFPFNWEYRFPSPISYWDRRHYAEIVSPLEHLFDLAVLIFYSARWVTQRFRRAPSV